ncbi:MAG: ABC-F family ATP-binding cassette domain-containing protein [Myxococcota bacterium]|nr:ABC-F family ATP-binding cassette domain-containing protein [Myxococcota bacterium]
MMLQAQEIEVSFGDSRVLRGADFQVSAGECVGLVGRNGSGKSTLLKVLAGALEADRGTVRRQTAAGLLEQLPELPGNTVQDALDDSIAWHTQLMLDYEEALAADEIDEAMRLQDRLDDVGWEFGHRVDGVCERLKVPAREAEVSVLSGGEGRRLALARALLSTPDLLLLDEPTNHLDAETIEWLQGFLSGYRGAVVLVTHDRYLLEAVADRIVEVEDGLTISYDGSYADYLLARADRRSRLEKAEASRVSTLAREAAWACRSPAARSTRQKARLKRLEQLREERPLFREQTFELDLRTGFKAGKSILELDNLSGGYAGNPLFSGVMLSVHAGDRVAIVGPNGIGKSTLFRLIQREIEPMAGHVHRAPRVKLATIDQARTGLDPTDSLFEAAGGGASHVEVAGHSVHVAGFLKRFLFRREQLDQPVSTVSGGERMRLLLARLLLGGANVLLLDEPTNDLDLMTLRVLEEALIAFDGASLIISHDRALVDRVCNVVLAFEGGGQVTRYASRLQAIRAHERSIPVVSEAKKAAPVAQKAPSNQDGLSWKERKELEELPARLEGMEAQRKALEETLSDPLLYKGGGDEVAAATRSLKEVQDALAAGYARWEELESRQ